MKARERLHIMWDSDGSLDGVIGLLCFLQHPNVSVHTLTLSCGVGHPDIYAPNLLRMLARVGRRRMPVAAGRSTALRGSNAFPPPWRAATDAFFEIELPEAHASVLTLPAAKLIVKALKESTNPVSLFVCGTHTNLAQALRLDPTIKANIASVHIMGGALRVPGNIAAEWPEARNRVAEWNIWVDPAAADEVFSAGLPLYMTPLDATNQVVWTSDDADTWDASGTPEGELAAEILRWYLDYLHDMYPEGVHLWDLVAAANVMDPDLCQSERVHVQVVTGRGDEEGRTLLVEDQPPNATAYLTPKPDEIKHFVARTLGLPRDEGSEL
jgi:purine nucleosidase/pyrimidine-specific ribonucleoside hydrolase